jgi:glycine hydroxymethyltransferase
MAATSPTAPVNFSGQDSTRRCSTAWNEATGEIDYEQVERLALECKPKMIIAGFSAYSRVVDWAKFRAIADEWAPTSSWTWPTWPD